MKRRKIKKQLLCLLVMVTTLLTGCFGRADSQLLRANQVVYDGNISVLEQRAGDKASLFADNLCIVTDEGGFVDEAIQAGAAIIFGITDQKVVFSNHAHEKLYPASITKLTTVLVALKHGALDAEVTVTEEALANLEGSSLAGLHLGDKLTLKQLLYAALLPSGNDAANAIAIHVGGSVENFVNMMNDEVKKLGATHTNYTNPHGLTDENHYTTAYDIYLILNELAKDDRFNEIIETASYDAEYQDKDGNPVQKTFKSTVRYAGESERIPENVQFLGGKTGTTTAAGSCLAMLCQDADGRRYIAVVLKAKGRDALYEQMDDLLTKIYN